MSTFIGNDVGDIEKRISLQTDVDKSRIHAWQNVLDNALKNRTDDTLVSLNTVFHELAIFEEGDSGLSV